MWKNRTPLSVKMAAEPDRNGGCRDSSDGEPDLNRDGEEQDVEQQSA